jgi:hypothetical protein
MKPALSAVRQLVALVVLSMTLALPAGAQPVGDHLKCKWGTCPLGMTCGGVPKSGACGFDCACQ